MLATIPYIKDYLDMFDQMMDILLEYLVTNRTQTKTDEHPRELRHLRVQTSKHITPLKRCRNLEADWEEGNNPHTTSSIVNRISTFS